VASTSCLASKGGDIRSLKAFPFQRLIPEG
jgi:hypothetical protein